MQIDVSSMLSLPDGLEVAEISVADPVLTIHIVATTKSNACPLCKRVSIRIRSYYTRLVADVPCGGRQVQLILRVRKFRCETTDCPRRVFTERLAPFLEPWARMTTRFSKTIEAIGQATCGELGARFAPHLGIHTSPTTVLRRTMALPTCPPEQVSLLGIDDWSFRRGRKFGTILVDLATHKEIDLLPDRTTETATAWMQMHPEIEVVSRDRGGDYAAADCSKDSPFQKIGFAAAYAQHGICTSQIRKIYFAAMRKTEDVFRRNLTRCIPLSKRKMSLQCGWGRHSLMHQLAVVLHDRPQERHSEDRFRLGKSERTFRRGGGPHLPFALRLRERALPRPFSVQTDSILHKT
jgi:hypothetical protein